MFKPTITLILVLGLLSLSSSLLTRKMLKAKMNRCALGQQCSEDIQINDAPKDVPILETSCSAVSLTAKYNYSGIVRSGYLKVSKGNSALAFIFYGRKDITDPSQLRNIPTILWLNGGPGSSSQLGNMQELGPVLLLSQGKTELNNYTWAKNYNLLFVDQPIGTGLSYADTTGSDNYFVQSMDDVATDFYVALNQLYNNPNGCFSNANLNIPATAPLVIFGESYAGKYVPAIAKKIVEQSEQGGFLKGLKGVAIGDGFTFPYQIMSEMGSFAFHLSLIDYQQRQKLQRILINASRHHLMSNYKLLHDDFQNAYGYLLDRSPVNVYDIKIDGQYEELLQPYFRNKEIRELYALKDIEYDGQADLVYENLYEDFMKNEINRVEYLLTKGMQVLIYQGQDDLIVTSPGTTKWVDRIHHAHAEQFRRQLYSAWRIQGKVVGSIKRAGALEFRIVNKAGHMVPMDRPVEALELATSFVSRVTGL